MRNHGRILLFVVVVAWCGIAAVADEASDSFLVDRLTRHLTGLPTRDLRPLRGTLVDLFGSADQAKLLKLADHPNWNVAMWARWELRRTSHTPAFNINNRLYPLRFLELKGIGVPPAWAKEFASQFFLTDFLAAQGPGGFHIPTYEKHDPRIKALYDQAVEYYDKRAAIPSKTSFIDMNPSTYVHYAEADVPVGTVVRESKTTIVVEQAGMTVRLKKPLTRNLYSFVAGTYGENVFLPLVTREKTVVLTCFGSHTIPYELTLFDTKSGRQDWETVGWSGWPQTVRVLPRNVLSPDEEAVLSRMLVGQIKPPGPDNDPGRGGGASGPHYGACCWYLTANDEYVAVFGSEGVLSLEIFDIKTGRNVLRFATDYHGMDTHAAWERLRENGDKNDRVNADGPGSSGKPCADQLSLPTCRIATCGARAWTSFWRTRRSTRAGTRRVRVQNDAIQK